MITIHKGLVQLTDTNTFRRFSRSCLEVTKANKNILWAETNIDRNQ